MLEEAPVTPHPPAGSGMKIPILFGLVALLIGVNAYLLVRMSQVQQDLGKTRDSLIEEIAKVREASSVTYQTNRRTVEALQRRLDQQKVMASQAAGQARADALKSIDATRQKLEAAQAQQQELVKTEISDVKQAADSKFTEVGTEVSGVKSDLATTKSEQEKLIADLKRVNGDLDGHGALIATNAKELGALKALGERNYFEFKIAKSNAPQKVGDVLIQLKRADPKRNRFTIELTADDKKVEKKDRTVNEPLQFYTSKARQPNEIVINEVTKNEIAGYLATPKVQQVRN